MVSGWQCTTHLLILSLELFHCSNITDAGLNELRHMSSLTPRDLVCCKKVSDQRLEELGHMSTLAALGLRSCKEVPDDGSLKELGQMPNITFLNLEHCGKIMEAGLNELKLGLDNCIWDTAPR